MALAIIMQSKRPVIGIPADQRTIGPHPFHAVGDKYVRAVAEAADAIPLLIPALGAQLHLEELMAHLDGILFTGSPSNVEPHRYKGEPSSADTLHDAARDATTLPLIPRAIDAGIPVFGICRGFQEFNVAMGGTLTQRLHEVPGLLDHRDDAEQPLDVQYGPAHDVALEPGGILARLAGSTQIRVNSLHSQGVQRLAPGLLVEARAPDGVVEAFRVKDSPSFALAVQWHPEWQVMKNPFSRAMFAAFGAASREHRQRK
jgi:putative glutamine amidotransferase